MNALWDAGTLVITPERRGAASVTDRAGSPLAHCDENGVLADSAGTVLLHAPVTVPGHGWREQRKDVTIGVTDAAGVTLGTGAVRKYTLTPRSRRLTVVVSAPGGGGEGKIEAADKHGDELSVTSNGEPVASVTVEHVKAGFMRKNRIYTAELTGRPSDQLAAPLVAAVIRYQALLDGVSQVAMRER